MRVNIWQPIKFKEFYVKNYFRFASRKMLFEFGVLLTYIFTYKLLCSSLKLIFKTWHLFCANIFETWAAIWENFYLRHRFMFTENIAWILLFLGRGVFLQWKHWKCIEPIFSVNCYLVRNPLKSEHILKGVQQAEHLQMLNACRSQSKEDDELQYEKETKKM